jgi:beta-glucosidase
VAIDPTAKATDADRDAVRRIDGIANRLSYDAILRGTYPDDVLRDLASVSDLTHIRDGDLAQIARPVDALGLNHYRRYHVRHQRGASAARSPWPGSPDVAFAGQYTRRHPTAGRSSPTGWSTRSCG